jgi:hypothetical protein
MKVTLLITLPIFSLTFGCTSFLGGNPGLPSTRPSDFSISSYEGGGMTPESEEYFVSEDSAGRVSFYEQSHNRWTFVPDPSRLDAFYDRIRQQDPTSITASDEGEVYDRGGISLHIEFDDHSFQVAHAGSSFVAERDWDRFDAVHQEIAAFVTEGLEANKVNLKVDFDLAVADTALANCSVSLSRERIAQWNRQNASPLTYETSLSLLPGQYMLNCWATISGKNVAVYRPIDITTEKQKLHITLKSDTFDIIQE